MAHLGVQKTVKMVPAEGLLGTLQLETAHCDYVDEAAGPLAALDTL
jgi:hypothetical protein